MIVSTPSNIRWATGFTGSAGTLVVGPTGAWLVTDGRYTDQAARQLAASGVGDDVEVVTATTVSAQQTSIVGLLAGVGAVGAEAGHMSHRQWTTFADGLGLVAVDGVVESLRRHKDADEIAWIAYACAIADRALVSRCTPWYPGSASGRCAMSSRPGCVVSGPTARVTRPSSPPVPTTVPCRTTVPPTGDSSTAIWS